MVDSGKIPVKFLLTFPVFQGRKAGLQSYRAARQGYSLTGLQSRGTVLEGMINAKACHGIERRHSTLGNWVFIYSSCS